MLKDLRLGLLLLLALLPGTASATTRHYEGCFVCDFILPTGSQAECSQVGDGENGTGWQCAETDFPDGPLCTTSGGACYNVSVNGGSGGTGGSQTCQTTGFCPAECFSCDGGRGRPAV